jgi:hypothetical protein
MTLWGDLWRGDLRAKAMESEMKRIIRKSLVSLLGAAAMGLAGCGTYSAGYAYAEPAGYDVYYDHGWYDGPNWYYYDRYHHLHHESRDFHVRRESYYRDHARSAGYHEHAEVRGHVESGAGHVEAGHDTGGHDGGGHR